MSHTYLITFHTYGTWLHGDQRGSVDPRHNAVDQWPIEANTRLMASDMKRMTQAQFCINAEARSIIHRTIGEVAKHRSWAVHALQVRSNHVHVVVTAPKSTPERVMNDFKSWSTRRLREAGIVTDDRNVWARHGSTRWIHGEHAFQRAVEYVTHQQGDPLPGARNEHAP